MRIRSLDATSSNNRQNTKAIGKLMTKSISVNDIKIS